MRRVHCVSQAPLKVHQKIRTFVRVSKVSDLGLKNTFVSNNTAQFFYVGGELTYLGIFFNLLADAPDIHSAHG